MSGSFSGYKRRWPRPRRSLFRVRAHARSTIGVAMLPLGERDASVVRTRQKSSAIIATSAFCTWNNLCKHECSQAKTNSIRELDERLGAICGLAVRGESPASHRDRRGARRCRDTRYSTVHGLPLECPGGISARRLRQASLPAPEWSSATRPTSRSGAGAPRRKGSPTRTCRRR